MMKRTDRARYEARSRIVKAMAHPSRLLVLDALAERELCVCEITELIGADQSTVSKHLSILRQVGLIEDRREGSKIYYRLKCKCLKGFWDCIERVLRTNVKEQQALLAP